MRIVFIGLGVIFVKKVFSLQPSVCSLHTADFVLRSPSEGGTADLVLRSPSEEGGEGGLLTVDCRLPTRVSTRWQPDRKSTALPRFTANFYTAMMGINYLFYHSQAEPCSADALLLFDPVKWFKDMRYFIGRYTHALSSTSIKALSLSFFSLINTVYNAG
jgi:hypothetical protein